MAKIGDWRRDKTPAILSSLLFGALTATAAYCVLFWLAPPAALDLKGRAHTLGLHSAWTFYWDWLRTMWPPIHRRWQWEQSLLQGSGLLSGFIWRAKTITGAGVGSGVIGFLSMLTVGSMYRVGMRHVRGRIVVTDLTEAVRQADREFAKRRRYRGGGLFLAPGVQMDLPRETEGIALIGAPGSGKTVVYRNILNQILERSKFAADEMADGATVDDLELLPDKIIQLCVKGDFTAQWPDDEFMLLAPHDTGVRIGKDQKAYRIGYAWDIGKDLRGIPAARDFADRVVKPTNEPVWGEAARAIVAGAIITLQRTMDTNWTWVDLYRILKLDAEDLHSILAEHYGPAAKFVQVQKGTPTRTTSSYLANIETGVFPLVEALASAWHNYPKSAYISLTEWILDEAPKKRVLILQRSGEVLKISEAWQAAVVSTLAKFVASPRLPESKKRRIWMSLDEAAQVFQKDDGFLQVSEVGRSKGFCTILGLQVTAQVKEAWSEAQMESLEAMIRTVVYFRVSAGKFAETLAEHVIGSSDWIRRDVSLSIGRERSRTVGQKEHRELAVMPNFFSSELGDGPCGITGLYIGGVYCCRLLWPYQAWPQRREPTVSADWVYANRFEFIIEGGAQAPAPTGKGTPGSLYAAPMMDGLAVITGEVEQSE